MTCLLRTSLVERTGHGKAGSREAAILLYVQDAGYPTVDAATEACGISVERFRRDLIVVADKFFSEPSRACATATTTSRRTIDSSLSCASPQVARLQSRDLFNGAVLV
jgi:DeoR/GlpR family transcriptional regulator of sugar metabolism